MHAFGHDGTHKWTAGSGNADPQVADLDADGNVEVVHAFQVISGSGQVLWAGSPEAVGGGYTITSVADLNGDGYLDLTLGGRAYSPLNPNLAAPLLWDTGLAGGFTAVADFDGDGGPEVLVAAGVEVGFYAGDPADGGMLLGVVKTDGPLPPGSEATLSFSLDVQAVPTPVDVFVVIDPAGKASECDEGNNTVVFPQASC